MDLAGTVFWELSSSWVGKMRKEQRRETECPWITGFGGLEIGWGRKIERRAGQEVLATVAPDLILDPPPLNVRGNC